VAATLPKPGNTSLENEDAIGGNTATLRFAVADGATEGWKSGEWARHLVSSYVLKPPMPANFKEWIARVRNEWSEMDAVPAEDEPWFIRAKRKEGAYSTLAGFELKAAKDGRGWRWKALAAGDSCFFLIREGRLVESFPLNAVEQFGMTPKLLASSPQLPFADPEWLAGTATDGDVLALATDAVAAGLMIAAAKNEKSWTFEVLSTDSASLRKRNLLDFMRMLPCPREDDLSLLAVHLPTQQEIP
jgi:hypothetical protein